MSIDPRYRKQLERTARKIRRADRLVTWAQIYDLTGCSSYARTAI